MFELQLCNPPCPSFCIGCHIGLDTWNAKRNRRLTSMNLTCHFLLVTYCVLGHVLYCLRTDDILYLVHFAKVIRDQRCSTAGFGTNCCKDFLTREMYRMVYAFGLWKIDENVGVLSIGTVLFVVHGATFSLSWIHSYYHISIELGKCDLRPPTLRIRHNSSLQFQEPLLNLHSNWRYAVAERASTYADIIWFRGRFKFHGDRLAREVAFVLW